MTSTEPKFKATGKILDVLYTVHGDDPTEFKANLDNAIFMSGSVEAFALACRAIQPATVPIPAPVSPPASTYAPAVENRPAPGWAAAPAAAPAPAGHNCIHGERAHRTGTSQATGKPWAAYFCPTPKGTVGQCEPEFVR